MEKVFTAESFGEGPIPVNYEQICEYLNNKLESSPEGTSGNDVWEAYWNGDYSDAPEAITD